MAENYVMTDGELMDAVLTSLTMMARVYELQGDQERVSFIDGIVDFFGYYANSIGVHTELVKAIAQIQAEAQEAQQLAGQEGQSAAARMGIDLGTLQQLHDEIARD